MSNPQPLWDGLPVLVPPEGDDLKMGNSIKRRIWVTDSPGNLRSLHQENETLPPPGLGEVRVKVESIGLNFADVFTVLGMYDAAPKGKRVIPGLEFSGVVEEVGRAQRKKISKVGRSADGKRNIVVEGDSPTADSSSDDVGRYPFRPGDRVMGVTRFGAYASHLNIATPFIRKIPEGWSFQEGAAFVVQALTAWYGLVELGKAAAGKTVLVHSAAGGVGSFALQICRILGMVPVAVVGSEDKAKFVADKFFLDRSQIIIRPRGGGAFAARLQQALVDLRMSAKSEIEGYDIVMDSLAGQYFQPAYDALARGGRHVIFGAAVYTPSGDRGLVWWSPRFWFKVVPTFLRRPRVDVQKMIGQNKAVMGFNLIWLTDGTTEPKVLGRLIDEMMAPAVRWAPPIVGKEFAFEETLDAMRYFKSGKSVGKVVINIDK